MRTIFQISNENLAREAEIQLAHWLYFFSEEFSAKDAKFEDALTTAKEFLAENQRRRFIET